MGTDSTHIMSKKAIKRESIVRAAIEVFSSKDFKTASISEIAQKAGVANGTIYQ
jgi:AcrR family transcriptional regulator